MSISRQDTTTVFPTHAWICITADDIVREGHGILRAAARTYDFCSKHWYHTLTTNQPQEAAGSKPSVSGRPWEKIRAALRVVKPQRKEFQTPLRFQHLEEGTFARIQWPFLLTA